MRAPHLLVVGLLAVLVAPVAGGEGAKLPGYRFTLDGDEFTPQVFSLNGTPDTPRPGDVIWVVAGDDTGFDKTTVDLLLVLGEEGEYRFKTTPTSDGRLLIVGKDGKDRVIGVQVAFADEDEQILVNPLAKLSDEELRGLRGIRLDTWPAGIEGRLKLVDPARACITITGGTAQGLAGRFPALPPDLQYLWVDETSKQGIRDFSALAGLRALRFLRLRPKTLDAFDARLLKAHSGLFWLECAGSQLENPAALAALVALRELRLPWREELKDISFVRRMKQLRALNIRGSQVSDLSRLDGLAELARVNADEAPVERLPRGPLPALRELRILGTKLTDDSVAKFARAHPDCQMLHRWGAALRSTLAGVTRLSVRSGGTCHRNLAKEKTLIEVEGAALREVLGKLEIDEARCGGDCDCCGHPTFEFYRGNQLLAALSLHHAGAFRWPGGWPGDGVLTDASEAFLCEWLAKHGVREPAEERAEHLRNAAAFARRDRVYKQLVPAAVLKLVDAARTIEEAAVEFRRHVKDPIERAVLALKLFGCADTPWNGCAGRLEYALRDEVLPKVSPAELVAAIRKVADDPAGADGAARWLFGEGKWPRLDEMSRQDLVSPLARRALGHPRSHCRGRTMLALRDIKDESSVGLLRSVLGGQIAIRQLPKDEQGGPEGMDCSGREEVGLVEGASDRACAALILASLGDRASLPVIHGMAKAAEGADRKALDEAIRLLTEDQ